MKCVIQRVKSASVTVEGKVVGAIGQGVLVYLGADHGDSEKELDFVAEKIPNLRIFPDEDDKMNLSLWDVDGAILLVSQFTLYGDCRKGRRPGFSDAAKPELAKELYERLINKWRGMGIQTETGIFQSDMLVESVNWGPATFILDTKAE
ncbi:MAG: D-aminoacyl-tRNA deacylase [Bacillota bacterium]|nr:D-aminoacyl-tRNA deacylase [Bacillota bacterium]